MVINALKEPEENQTNDGVCPTCGGTDIVYDPANGEYVCEACGLVIVNDQLDMKKEWNAYTVEEIQSRERAGPPMIGAYKESVHTKFNIFKDGTGKQLSFEAKQKMWRLQKQNTMASLATSESRNLRVAKSVLKLLIEKMNLTGKFYDDSLCIYKKALSKNLIMGKSIEGFIAASVYAVCREMGLPRPLNEIARNVNMDPLTVGKFYRELVRELSMKMPIDEPMKYTSKFATKLRLDRQIELRAVEILMNAKKSGLLQGKRPNGMAAAALYLSARENYIGITQKEFAKTSGVSEVTLRNGVKVIKGLSLVPNS